MIRNDIALDIKDILGEKYRLYIDNNAGEFLNIEKNMTPQKQIDMLKDKISVVFKTAVGELIALKNLYTSSCAFSLEFYTPIIENIYPDINALVESVNGNLQERGEYRYIMTFTTPFVSQNLKLQNGQYYTVITLAGNLAHSDGSGFFNDAEFYINNVKLKGVVNYAMKTSIITEEKQAETGVFPLIAKKYIVTTLQLTMHLRTDDTIAIALWKLCPNPEQLTLPAGDIYKNLKINIFKAGENSESITWSNAEIIDIQTDSAIGGYVTLSVIFQRKAEM